MTAGTETELLVEGMTCGACAARVERALGKLEDVQASINYATGRAAVTHAETVAVDDLVAAVERAGYTARRPEPLTRDDPAEAAHERDLVALRQRLAFCATLSLPVIVLSMVPAVQFPYWQWTALGLTAPVALWGALPMHRAALANLHHASATMDTLQAPLADAAAVGHSAVLLAWGGRARAVFVVADTVRPTSTAAVAELRRLGLEPVLLTGDGAGAAHAVADAVGITTVVAEALPTEKVDVIARLQAEGRVVAMVGDGVNDAAALAQADLGIAMGTGTDIAMSAADITLVRADLAAAADAVRLSRRTLAVIKGNLTWAFGYNVLALPIAAAGLLQPLFAGAAMAASSLLVVTNSLRLARFRARVAQETTPTAARSASTDVARPCREGGLRP